MANEVENVGTRYLFDKNETGLTLEDNLISVLEWDIAKKGNWNAFSYIGGNYIKLTHLPKGIKLYWNTKNDRASAMLLDDINRGVKVSKQNKYGQLMNYRNYYLWSEGTLDPEETNTTIVLEITGKGVEVEYLIGSATEIQLLADQFNALNNNLEAMVKSLENLEVISEATAISNPIEVTLPEDFSCTCVINTTQINKISTELRPSVTITNHNNHWHIHLNWTAAQTTSANVTAMLNDISNYILNQNIGILQVSSNYNIQYQLGASVVFQSNIMYVDAKEAHYDEVACAANVKGIQSLTQTDSNFNFYNVGRGTQSYTGVVSSTANLCNWVTGGSIEGMRLLKNQTNYIGLAIGQGMSNATAQVADLAQFIKMYYLGNVTGKIWQVDYVFAIEKIWK